MERSDGPARELSAQHGFLLSVISSTYARCEADQGPPGGGPARLVLRSGRVTSSLAVGGQPAGGGSRARGGGPAAGADQRGAEAHCRGRSADGAWRCRPLPARGGGTGAGPDRRTRGGPAATLELPDGERDLDDPGTRALPAALPEDRAPVLRG